MHGHDCIVVLELSAEDEDRTDSGFVRDFCELSVFKAWVDAALDHRHLNEAIAGLPPSAENLARWIFDTWAGQFPELGAVKASETPKTWAVHRP
ncbi:MULTISPECIES: 6-carboxytetrahydropterin synthase [unclassified Streptomyces]|uniref:6-pyruvoyl trahydropterin synthase family protein n=1 Tax=Streptomyces TaxID=1883 RepID=UPI0001C1B150|nr:MULTISPECIES: 6-carboxytetrahydropterin synthase [unclassified Streptomyces]SCD53595.1 6-pyruvoyltetrahydropterin/6-carboxytetrahydropterin synthase [Streptomyces sp. DpondAA-F4a]SCL86241.1 6-pyruvoyltetrahydropterin/6-carboxytetrahydropterin synthase [Streptomyces sp. DpondAA-F4]PZX35053.1 6-pyruvoyltetrahydropterin/6-carboxytetrahydropterin synthase [Streptomyces sp. DvalAA-21]RAJ41102.1 6-pyruvoyltetrahydropterin/6-carboxytetrahydropterin synthase [Streptomyces sp. DpondAA-E10]RAJ43822.1